MALIETYKIVTIKDLIESSQYSWDDVTDLFNSWLKDQQENGRYLNLPQGGINSTELHEYRNYEVNSRKAHVGRAFYDFMNR